MSSGHGGVDPDCRDGKHGSCVGWPCVCDCHDADSACIQAISAIRRADMVGATMPGSVLVECSSCRRLCWIDRTSQRQRRRFGTPVLCTVCMPVPGMEEWVPVSFEGGPNELG